MSGSSRWSHWHLGGRLVTAQQFLFGRELGDEEELCPSCHAPLLYDFYDGPIRECDDCLLYWLHDDHENGHPGHPQGVP